MGNKLNIPKTRLIKTVKRNTDPSRTGKVWGRAFKIWKIMAAIIAKEKLAKMPAAETKSSPRLKLVKFKGLTGTGFAQPKRIGEPVKIKRAGSKIVPIRSIWGIGFKVNLPARSAV